MPDRKENEILSHNPQLCSVTEFCDVTGYHPKHVRKSLRNGTMVGVRIYTGSRTGFIWLIPRSSVPYYIEKHKHPMKGIKR